MNKPNKKLKIKKIKLIKLHSGRRSRAPTGDFTVAFGHGHPLVLGLRPWAPTSVNSCLLTFSVDNKKLNPNYLVCFMMLNIDSKITCLNVMLMTMLAL